MANQYLYILYKPVTTNYNEEKIHNNLEEIMQTSVIGFPRIGTLRELKFASEKYFKKEMYQVNNSQMA